MGEFFHTRTDSTFPSTSPDSTIFRYSHRFDLFRVLVGSVFPYSHRFYLSEYFPGFYHFSVLTQSRPFCGTRRESFSILVPILAFPCSRPDSTIFRYSHRFDPFQILAERVFRYSYRFYLFRVLPRILPFFGTHTDSTLFRYSLGQFFDTRTNSTISRYLPGFYHFSVLTQIRPFSGTCGTNFRYSYRF